MEDMFQVDYTKNLSIVFRLLRFPERLGLKKLSVSECMGVNKVPLQKSHFPYLKNGRVLKEKND